MVPRGLAGRVPAVPMPPSPQAGLRWVPAMGCEGGQRRVSGCEPRAAPAAALPERVCSAALAGVN